MTSYECARAVYDDFESAGLNCNSISQFSIRTGFNLLCLVSILNTFTSSVHTRVNIGIFVVKLSRIIIKTATVGSKRCLTICCVMKISKRVINVRGLTLPNPQYCRK